MDELASDPAMFSPELRRIACLLERDYETLEGLLDDDLTHIHADGRVEGKVAYLDTVANRLVFHRIDRSDMSLAVSGGLVILNAVFDQTIEHTNTGEKKDLRLMVMQAWRSRNDAWRLFRFQATRLG